MIDKSITYLIKIVNLIAEMDYQGGLLIFSNHGSWAASFLLSELKSEKVTEFIGNLSFYETLEEALMELIKEYFEEK